MSSHALQPAAIRILVAFALAFSCLLISGCSGCRDDDPAPSKQKKDEEEKKKKKEKPKPDFVTRTPILLPGWFPKESLQSDTENSPPVGDILPIEQLAPANNPAIRFNRAKPGHWVEASFQVIANNNNADGILTSSCVDSSGQPVPIPSTDYFLTTTRPASLPKSEWKNLETSVFLPRRNPSLSRAFTANVRYSLDHSRGGTSQITTTQPTSLLKPFQQHLVLLSERPDTYNFLRMADSIQLSNQRTKTGDLIPPFYFIVPTVYGDPLPLPRQSLHWTTIAYLIWDDLDPQKLSTDHQDALLDWLHFGGQLILSGPDCLDRLQGSFLGPYLPAQFDGSRNITNESLRDLNQNWTVPVANNAAEKRTFVVSESVPLLGVQFKPHTEANFVEGTGDLAIERAVGRGRMVVTAFSLNAPLVRKWRSFPSFLNNVLLRRLPRKFFRDADSNISYRWADDDTNVFDPLVGSTLRYLSRDLGDRANLSAHYSLVKDSPQNFPGGYAEFESEMRLSDFESETARDETIDNSPVGQNSARQKLANERSSKNNWHFGGYSDAPQSGVAGWNDDSGIAMAARETLIQAAGITPPSSMFVLKMLAAYLAVLVPLNWLIFRCLGKVEWAWAAAPVIAIVGAVLVVRMASLDIGFVRSNTQIGLLEIHADYPRAHLTEYSALYTSLSTGYNVNLDNPTAQSLPFARVFESSFARSNDPLSEVQLKRTVQNRLEGFQIQSNSTGLLHSETMLDLEGVITCQTDDQRRPTSVANGSGIDLKHVGILHRTAGGNYQVAWIGEMTNGSIADKLKFESCEFEQTTEPWRKHPLFAQASELPPPNSLNDQPFDSSNETNLTVSADSTIGLGILLDTIANTLLLSPGESRLMASFDGQIGRTKFDPAATQTDQQTLVLVHLRRPPLPAARRDENALTDFTGKSDLDWIRENDELDNLFNP